MRSRRALLISYYLDEPGLVGSIRPTYWSKNWNVACPDSDLDVITASTVTSEYPARVSISQVQNTGRGMFRNLILDPGYTWKNDVLKELSRRKLAGNEYDVVILTGGPFLHFRIVKKLKELYRAKIVLDFRDPFIDNFDESWLKGLLKKMVLKQILSHSDVIVTVNRYYANAMQRLAPNLRYIEISNGYDEEFVQRASPKGDEIIRLFHPGKIYSYAGFGPLVSALENFPNIQLDHVGPTPANFRKIPNLTFHGIKSYSSAMAIGSESHIGVLFLDDTEYKTPTKTFDYIGLGLPILIISNSGKLGDALTELLENFPYYKILKPDFEEICNFLGSPEFKILVTQRPKIECLTPYQRGSGLKRLIEVAFNAP